ncbi:aminotransferase class I/II-fold pyridoxal phosphate-dependent enzyme [Bacteroidota bacterium]
MQEFQPFVMERWMSNYEQDVNFNLSESGVEPMKLKELLVDHPGHIQHLMESRLNYPWVNGIPELRENIANQYLGAKPENVLVTVGAIEANYISINTLLSPGDEIVIMFPNYMQIWGIAKNLNLSLRTFNLIEKNNWAPDLDELEDIVSDKTKLIAICNPNNPTGYILTNTEMKRIVNIASNANAWILSDEVYSGAERLFEKQTNSFYGLYNKVIAVGSTSKAYGLPGLRIGWAVGPENVIDEIWARHEYTAISATFLSNNLAAIALSPAMRHRIINRTRKYIRDGYPVLNEWVEKHKCNFSFVPPQAAAIAFVKYNMEINSTDFAERLYREKSVLIVPGDHFGIDKYIRISFGLPHEYLKEGLDKINELTEELESH